MFREYTAIVDSILQEGKSNGCIAGDLDNEMFKAFLFGGFNHVTLRWYILGHQTDQDKMAEINGIVSLLVDAVVNPEHSPSEPTY